MKGKSQTSQAVALKVFSMQRFIQGMQAVAVRSCTRACQLFCLPVAERKTLPADQTSPLREGKSSPVTDRLLSPPSTVLVINISNCTLVDCVIGDSHPSAAVEQQPLMQVADEVSCSCCHRRQGAAQSSPPPPPHPAAEHSNICIHSSHLNSVIIGDNNYMQIQQNEPFD